MKKGKLNLLQKITTREIVGEVTNKTETYRGMFYYKINPVTLYSITKNGKDYYCGLKGHNNEISIGDKIRAYTSRGDWFVQTTHFPKKIERRGSVKVIETERIWEPIKEFEILENKL